VRRAVTTDWRRRYRETDYEPPARISVKSVKTAFHGNATALPTSVIKFRRFIECPPHRKSANHITSLGIQRRKCGRGRRASRWAVPDQARPTQVGLKCLPCASADPTISDAVAATAQWSSHVPLDDLL
jgi:hypothetical protein